MRILFFFEIKNKAQKKPEANVWANLIFYEIIKVSFLKIAKKRRMLMLVRNQKEE